MQPHHQQQPGTLPTEKAKGCSFTTSVYVRHCVGLVGCMYFGGGLFEPLPSDVKTGFGTLPVRQLRVPSLVPIVKRKKVCFVF